VDEELKGTKHGYLEALLEGNREEADVTATSTSGVGRRSGGCELTTRFP
jgi:hypothetical protein